MARINTTQLINATNLVSRACQVQQDPAVQKAWIQAGGDVATAAKSFARAAVETSAAWRRAGTGGGAYLTRLYA
jgi:hypothetical protein